jgi:hypothetical protein
MNFPNALLKPGYNLVVTSILYTMITLDWYQSLEPEASSIQ